MTTRRDASSSDLERARILARRLRPEGLLSPLRNEPEAMPATAYVRFEMPPPRPEPPPLQERLTRCLGSVGARGIVILDISGRPTAVAGEWIAWPPARLEAAAARLAVALDQAERIEGRWDAPRSIGIVVGADWLTAVRFGSTEARLTVGLLVDRPLDHEKVAVLARELAPPESTRPPNGPPSR